jgi:hypothetical protein
VKAAERVRGGPPHTPARVFEAHDQGLNRPRVTDLAQRVGGSTADLDCLAAQTRKEALDGDRAADLAEGFDCSDTDAHIVVIDRADEWLDRLASSDLAESHRGVAPDTPEVRRLQSLDETGKVPLGDESINVRWSEQGQGQSSSEASSIVGDGRGRELPGQCRQNSNKSERGSALEP